ncbi:MAG TPA: ABC transporter permease [Dongiaceae bacterium]|nr:ABC transporter permease [Dongiaceae bacterium]
MASEVSSGSVMQRNSSRGTMLFGNRQERVYWLFLAPVLLALLVFFLLPLLQVFWISFSDPSIGTDNYVRLVESRAIQKVVLTTLRICAITTAAAVLIGYVIAFTVTLAPPRTRSLLMFAILVPFWMSVLVRAFAWVTLLRNEGVINSFLMSFGIIDSPLAMSNNEFGVIIGMTHFMTPYAVLPLLASMDGINPALVAAARGLGAGTTQSFLKVFLPLTKPGIFAATILVFIMTLGFFVTPIILGGGRTVMIAEYITVQMQQTLRWGLAAALATVLLAVVLLLIGLLSRSMDMRKILGGG